MHRVAFAPTVSHIVVITCLTALPGCSWLTRPMEKPVIEDNLRVNTFRDSKVGILSLNPERRAVLYNFKYERYCAENPTEVGVDMASASRLAAELEQAGSPKVGAQVALSAASNNYVLNRRSPGIILYQSSSYQFCQMYANKAIDEKEFVRLQEEALKTAERILTLETTSLAQVRVEEERRKTAEESRKTEAEKTEREFIKLTEAKAAKADAAAAAAAASTASATTTTTTVKPR